MEPRSLLMRVYDCKDKDYFFSQFLKVEHNSPDMI
jgi:hypothetical protein